MQGNWILSDHVTPSITVRTLIIGATHLTELAFRQLPRKPFLDENGKPNGALVGKVLFSFLPEKDHSGIHILFANQDGQLCRDWVHTDRLIPWAAANGDQRALEVLLSLVCTKSLRVAIDRPSVIFYRNASEVVTIKGKVESGEHEVSIKGDLGRYYLTSGPVGDRSNIRIGYESYDFPGEIKYFSLDDFKNHDSVIYAMANEMFILPSESNSGVPLAKGNIKDFMKVDAMIRALPQIFLIRD